MRHSLFLSKPGFTFDAIIRQQSILKLTSSDDQNIFFVLIRVVLC